MQTGEDKETNQYYYHENGGVKVLVMLFLSCFLKYKWEEAFREYVYCFYGELEIPHEHKDCNGKVTLKIQEVGNVEIKNTVQTW